MSGSNLAFTLEPEEALNAQTANAVPFVQLLRLSNAPTAADQLPRTTVRHKRRTAPASFKDNYSGDFRLFRVY